MVKKSAAVDRYRSIFPVALLDRVDQIEIESEIAVHFVKSQKEKQVRARGGLFFAL